ncbi:MAG: hypothetical protein SW127_12645, partial [Actinomycetota bacterium]|nr:hypothetical protein [Actinomycetota bacterium]
MKYVTFCHDDTARAGVIVGDDRVLDLRAALGDGFGTVQAIIEGGPRAWESVVGAVASPPARALLRLDSVEL